MDPTPQRLVFGSVAERYDRHRPGYPQELLIDLVGRTGLPPQDIAALDVGGGTGKVARALLALGVRGTMVEPDASMAAVAAPELEAGGWAIELSDFEGCRVTDASIDLLTCGQAWHWVEPVSGMERVRAVIRPGGVAAIFWNRHEWADPALRDALDRVYEEHAPGMSSSLATAGRGHKGLVSDIDPSGFTVVDVPLYPFSIDYSTQAWIDLLHTHSDHVLLDPEVAGRLYEAEARVIDDHGGSMRVDYRTEVWLGIRDA